MESFGCEAQGVYRLHGLEVEENVLDDLGWKVEEMWGVVRGCYRLDCCVRHGVGEGCMWAIGIVIFRLGSHCNGRKIYM